VVQVEEVWSFAKLEISFEVKLMRDQRIYVLKIVEG
jgi:hypothetical protein